MPLLVAVLLLLALIPFVLFRGSQVPEAEAAWWDNSWRYRKPIQVTNNTSQQNNVYISVSLDTSDISKFQDDCGDLRFTKQNGQLLPYHIVSGCGTASTSMHVQLDTFPAGAQTLYTYYGNLSAPNGSASNDFLMEATNYIVGGTGSEETAPGPVAYWKFDEGGGQVAHDSAGYSPGQDVLNDGDMETPDISAWTGFGSTLSKESDTPHEGSNYLRVTPTGSYPAARQQGLKVGQSYRFRGWVRIQAGYEWRVRCTTTNIITGYGNGDWEYIDVYFEATTDTLGLSGVNSGVPVEWDDVSVIETSSGNHGTITGATWAEEDQCVSGKCLSFDGVDDFITLGADSLPEVEGKPFTISAWVKTDISSSQAIITEYEAGICGVFTAYISSSNISFSRSTIDATKSSTDVTDNLWHMVNYTFDGTTGIIYVDGRVDTINSTSPGYWSPGCNETAIQIGARHGSMHFNGLIDEVKIFPYALTEDEIKAEYNLGATAVIGTGPAVPPPEGGNLNDSLVAHWALDEGYGTSVHSSVGSAHFTTFDNPTWKPSGKINGSLSFDGDDYVQLPAENTLQATTELSMTAWIKPDAYPEGSSAYFVGRYYQYGLFLDTAGQLRAHIRNTVPNWESPNSNTVIPLGTWTHVGLTFNNGNITFYVNGRAVQTATLATPAIYDHNDNPVTAVLGAYYNTTTNFYSGELDEVKIYNTALTPEQVLQDMNAGASLTVGVGANEADEIIDGAGAPPIAEWKFDEHQGTTAYDTSGNGNDGTVNGATWKSGCQQGACLEFDGVDDRVTISDDDALDIGTGSMTWELWFNVSHSNRNILYRKSDASNGNGFIVEIGIGTPGLLKCSVHYPAVSVTSSTSNWNDGNWHNASCVLDRTSATLKIYVDGVERGSSDADALDGIDLNANSGSSISSNPYVQGQIDHVKIYDYARTPAQIAYDYNRGKPVAHWRFDECEGAVAHDSSGNEHHGTINIGSEDQDAVGTCQTSGAWANGKDGKFNGSLNFDGTDDYVSIPYSEKLKLGNSGTIAAWYKPTTTNNRSRAIVTYGASTEYPTGYLINQFGSRLSVYWRTGTPSLSLENFFPVMNVWYHVVLVNNNGTLSVYKDGQIIGTGTSAGSITTNYTTNIGGSGHYYADAQIDDVRIYNYALSPAQILKVYNQGQAVNFTRAN